MQRFSSAALEQAAQGRGRVLVPGGAGLNSRVNGVPEEHGLMVTWQCWGNVWN